MESTRVQRMNFWWGTTQCILSTIIASNFIYLVARHNQYSIWDESRCAAKAGINHPIHITKDTDVSVVTDVAQQFYLIFLFGLAINSVTAI